MVPRSTILLTLLLVLAGLSAGCGGKPRVRYQPEDRTALPGQTEEWTFDKDTAGNPPAGSEVFGGAWEVRAETNAPSTPNALCQTATAEDFPAIRLATSVYTDLSATVRFKAVSGKDDQAAGIIFRVQDKDNYYILRANALEDNVILFRFGSGTRSTLKEESVKVPSGEWQDLRLEVEGNRFRGYLNDQLVVEATDDAYPAGGVGLWTKADSVTCFDDFRVTAK
jgi:3-keto-disaccharide hydrolase